MAGIFKRSESPVKGEGNELNEVQQPGRKRRLIEEIIRVGVFVICWLYITNYLMINEPSQQTGKIVPLISQVPYLVEVLAHSHEEICIELAGNFDVMPDYSTNPGIKVSLECFSTANNEVLWESDYRWVFLSDSKSKEQMSVEYTFKVSSETEKLCNNTIHVKFLNEGGDDTALCMKVNTHGMHFLMAIGCGIILLILLYVLLIFDIADRALVAMLVSSASIGSLFMLGECPELEEIIKWIEVETLVLLLAMMLMVSMLTETGIFDVMSVWMYKMSKGKVWRLLFILCMFTSIVAAIVDNLITVLLVSPITIRLCETLSLSTTVALISIAIFANIGGTITEVGEPHRKNIVADAFVAKQGIGLSVYTLHMVPGVILSVPLGFVVLYFLIRKKIYKGSAVFKTSVRVQRHADRLRKVDARLAKDVYRRIALLQKLEMQNNRDNDEPKVVDFEETLNQMKATCQIRNKLLLILCGIAFGFAFVMLFLFYFAFKGVPLTLTAFFAVILLQILTNRQDMDEVLDRIDWRTVVFFSGLFVLMEALIKMEVSNWIGELTTWTIQSMGKSQQLAGSIILVLWLSAIVSAFVDNVLISQVILSVATTLAAHPEVDLPFAPLVWSTIYGVCFGGSGSLFGLTSNLVVAGIAHQHGYIITFRSFFTIGYPVMIMTIIVATIYLFITHCLMGWHDPPI